MRIRVFTASLLSTLTLTASAKCERAKASVERDGVGGGGRRFSPFPPLTPTIALRAQFKFTRGYNQSEKIEGLNRLHECIHENQQIDPFHYVAKFS